MGSSYGAVFDLIIHLFHLGRRFVCLRALSASVSRLVGGHLSLLQLIAFWVVAIGGLRCSECKTCLIVGKHGVCWAINLSKPSHKYHRQRQTTNRHNPKCDQMKQLRGAYACPPSKRETLAESARKHTNRLLRWNKWTIRSNTAP